jgi:hypothetical protein
VTGSPGSKDAQVEKALRFLRFMLAAVAIAGALFSLVAITNLFSHFWGSDVITVLFAIAAAISIPAFRSLRKVTRLAQMKERPHN